MERVGRYFVYDVSSPQAEQNLGQGSRPSW